MTDKAKLFVLDICERAMNGACFAWANVTKKNKYTGAFTFHEHSEEDNEEKEIYKLGFRAVEDAIESIIIDPSISLPEEETEMALMYAYKYKDAGMLEDIHIDHIIQIAVFKDVVY